jgi:hypothetical protein
MKGLRVTAVCLGLLSLAFWIVQNSAVQALGKRKPQLAAAFAPSDPRVNAALVTSELPIGAENVSKTAIAAARSLVPRAPLAAEPFLIHGIAAVKKGKAKEAEALLREARHRNPRLRGARFTLLELYLRQDRVREAGTELAVLRRLVPELEAVVVPQLANLVRGRGSSAGLLEVLRQDPALHEAVLDEMAKSGADPDLILSMAPRRTARSARWQQLLLNRLVEEKQVRRAYTLWASSQGIAAIPGAKGVYDGAFRGEPGPPPFGWTLASTGAGVAEISRGALEGQFFGREDVTLASQLLMLRPGRHSLSFQVAGEARGDDGGLSWRIQCTDSEATLTEIPLSGTGAASRSLSATFNVPAGCEAQWLALVGEAGDVPQMQTVTVRDLQVKRES